MTADPRTSVLYKPSWVPREHTMSVVAGVEFDAVRVRGRLAEMVAGAVEVASVSGAGPVVWGPYDSEWLFIVPPGSTAGVRWPPGVVVFNAARPEPVMIPALWGNTYPLRWWSTPLQDAHFVDVSLLLGVLCDITGWRSLSARGG